jgi:hypothetical protein
MTNDCSHNTDPLKLVREGTSQDERLAEALDPAYAPVNEHAVAHNMVFARDYAALLKYFNDQNLESGDWVPFFGTDVSVQLAIAAIEDIDSYKACVNSSFDYLNNLENQANETDLKNQFGYLYAYIGTLAQGLDALKEDLPAEIALKGILQNLIQTQLAPLRHSFCAVQLTPLPLLWARISRRTGAEFSIGPPMPAGSWRTPRFMVTSPAFSCKSIIARLTICSGPFSISS